MAILWLRFQQLDFKLLIIHSSSCTALGATNKLSYQTYFILFLAFHPLQVCVFSHTLILIQTFWKVFITHKDKKPTFPFLTVNLSCDLELKMRP